MHYSLSAAGLMLLGLLGGAQSAAACSCAGLPKTLNQAFKTYPYIFSGRVKAKKVGAGGRTVIDHGDGTKTVTESPREFDVLFEVKDVFRGEIPSYVSVRTSENCQDPFGQDEYLVFAERSQDLTIRFGACALSYSKSEHSAQFDKYSSWLKDHTKEL